MLTRPGRKAEGSSRSKSWGQVASRTPVTEFLPKRPESGKKLKVNIKYLKVLPGTGFESRKRNSSLFITLLQRSASRIQISSLYQHINYSLLILWVSSHSDYSSLIGFRHKT